MAESPSVAGAVSLPMKAFCVVSIVLSVVAGVALAAMQRGPKPETAVQAEREGPWEQGRAAAEAGDCKTALPLLERAVSAAPRDAEALNLVAYCQRRSGRLDEAIANYRRALEIRPEFPAAREYLGEAHIQAALREIEILRSYGDSATEEVTDLVRAFREAADSVIAGGPPTGHASEDRKRW